ncbi:hypothetical protein MRM63_15405 [bacterium 19MO03SA05]|uniref:WYL domain-containing protein n=1 Tax=bacterium 19MO03SA05 TaxID=2920620 RepID=A0AAU6VKA1_UNCXX
MKAKLTQEMSENIRNAIGIESLKFKYGPAFDIYDRTNEPAEHRVMCKGAVTENKWVWLGNSKGIYSFESPSQARLFVREIKAEALKRKESSNDHSPS